MDDTGKAALATRRSGYVAPDCNRDELGQVHGENIQDREGPSSKQKTYTVLTGGQCSAVKNVDYGPRSGHEAKIYKDESKETTKKNNVPTNLFLSTNILSYSKSSFSRILFFEQKLISIHVDRSISIHRVSRIQEILQPVLLQR